METRNHLEQNKNENARDQNLPAAAKAVVTEEISSFKCIY